MAGFWTRNWWILWKFWSLPRTIPSLENSCLRLEGERPLEKEPGRCRVHYLQANHRNKCCRWSLAGFPSFAIWGQISLVSYEVLLLIVLSFMTLVFRSRYALSVSLWQWQKLVTLKKSQSRNLVSCLILFHVSSRCHSSRKAPRNNCWHSTIKKLPPPLEFIATSTSRWCSTWCSTTYTQSFDSWRA